MSTKTLIGGLLAGIITFFLGWIIYGMLLSDFMASNAGACMLPEEEMSIGLIAASNLLMGILYALVLGWANTSSAADGLKKGLLIAVLIGLGWDLMLHSMTNFFENYTAIVVDVLAYMVMVGIASAFLGWFFNRDKKAAAAA
jgi:hypothetical protein